jgi:thioredoxin-related protein
MSRFVCVLPLLLAPLIAQDDKKSELWLQDFAKAKAQAKAEKKDLLLDFTGSDWCGWCIKLDKEVFAQDAFVAGAPKHFVLVKLDFPQDESLVTPEIKKQNEQLQKQYPVQGFPTILLCTADGVVYHQTGYEKDGPEKYVEMLVGAHKKGAAFQTALADANGKKGIERAKLLDAALGNLDEDVVKGHHLETMTEIVTLDADGKGGLKAKYETKVQEIRDAREIESTAQELQELVGPLMQEGKGKEAIAKLDEAIKAPKHKVHHQLALFFKGMVTMDVDGDAKVAIECLEAAKKILPESPVAKRIDQVLPDLKKQADEKGG